MSITPDQIAWLGLLLGVSARIAVPYLRKLWAHEITQFDIYYIWQGIAGFGLALIVAVLLAPNILINPNATYFQLIVTNFVIGFGATSLINEILAIGQPASTQPAATTIPPGSPSATHSATIYKLKRRLMFLAYLK